MATAKTKPTKTKPAKQAADAKACDASFSQAQRRSRNEVMIMQAHLAGPGVHSWRGVRLRDVGSSAHRKAEINGAKIAGQDAGVVELRNAQLMECVVLFVVAYTDKPVRDPNAEGVVWKEANAASLSADGVWDDLFTASDTELLMQLYMRRHGVDPKTSDLLQGKLRPVAMED